MNKKINNNSHKAIPNAVKSTTTLHKNNASPLILKSIINTEMPKFKLSFWEKFLDLLCSLDATVVYGRIKKEFSVEKIIQLQSIIFAREKSIPKISVCERLKDIKSFVFETNEEKNRYDFNEILKLYKTQYDSYGKQNNVQQIDEKRKGKKLNQNNTFPNVPVIISENDSSLFENNLDFKIPTNLSDQKQNVTLNTFKPSLLQNLNNTHNPEIIASTPYENHNDFCENQDNEIMKYSTEFSLEQSKRNLQIIHTDLLKRLSVGPYQSKIVADIQIASNNNIKKQRPRAEKCVDGQMQLKYLKSKWNNVNIDSTKNLDSNFCNS